MTMSRKIAMCPRCDRLFDPDSLRYTRLEGVPYCPICKNEDLIWGRFSEDCPVGIKKRCEQ